MGSETLPTDAQVKAANDAYCKAWMEAWTKRFSGGYPTAPSFFHEWPKEAQEDQLVCIRAALAAALSPEG